MDRFQFEIILFIYFNMLIVADRKDCKNHFKACIYNRYMHLDISVSKEEFNKFVKETKNIYSTILNLKYKNKQFRCVIKEMQIHPVDERVIHVSFINVDKLDFISIYCPIEISDKTNNKYVKSGSKFIQSIFNLKCKFITAEIMEEIKIPIPEEFKGKFRISQLKDMLPNLKIIDKRQSNDTIFKIY